MSIKKVQNEERIAYVIPGEGARGAAQARILQWLADKGIKPDAIYGVSSGAINACGYSYLGPERLCELWSGLNSISKVFQLNYLTFPWALGLTNPSPISRILDREIPPGTTPKYSSAHIAAMERLSTKLVWGSTDDMPAEAFKRLTLGAVAIPGLVTPTDGLIDAGARLLAPLARPIEDGYRKIVVVSGTPVGVVPKAREGSLMPSLFQGLNFVNVLLDELMLRDIRKCLSKNFREGYDHVDITMYAPTEYLYDSLDFSEVDRGLSCTVAEQDIYSIQ